MIRSPLLLASVLALMLGACATDVAGESADAASAPALPASASDVASSPTVPTTSERSPAPTSPPTVGASPSLTTGDTTQYGTVLTDDSGMTLYVFFEDTEGQSMCYDACADNWPALVVDGRPLAEGGVDQGLIGTLQRDDGAMQVTYDGQPLYRHAGDTQPGDVRGFGNGNAWFPVAPDGAPIEMAGANSDAAGQY